MTDTKELSPVQVLREATTADLASEIGTARSVSGSAIRHGSRVLAWYDPRFLSASATCHQMSFCIS
jgi:hypothetical protein